MNSTFASRSQLFLNRAVIAAQTWYDAAGNWAADSLPAEVRERYWICCGLYDQGLDDLADAIILTGDTMISHMGWENPAPYDIFHTNIAAVLLRVYREKMSHAVREKLEELVRYGFAFQPGNRRPDYQFHGGNDNMPAKASMGLILGGELLDNPEAVEHGLWNLRQLRNMLYRRGVYSEWNSPTYSAATLAAIGKIAHYAENPEARELAAGIEERIWLDLAARFHPEMGVLAGPYSRAYNIDTLAHASGISTLLWFVLGDIVRPSPMELFNPGSGLVLHHKGDLPFNLSEKCWYATGTYHPSARVLELFARKNYPFQAVATAEAGGMGLDFPARPIRIETFLQPDFTVGTSSTPWFLEQTAHYVATYKRTSEVKSFKDVGTVYHKFTINEEVPGTIETATGPDGLLYSNSGEQDNLGSKANLITLQSGPTALVLTTPKPALGGFEAGQPPQPLTRLNDMVIFPSHFAGADEIRIGKRSCESWSGEVAHGEWVGCRRGRLLIAVRPLAFLPEPQTVKITLEKINNYEVLRSTFYEGPARTFTCAELRNVFGGFVAEHASIDEYPSLAAFIESLSSGLFTDYFWMTRRTRYRRPASAQRPALELETSWTPGSITPRYALINGLPVSQDTRVSIDGLTDADFPFLTGPWASVPSYFPWPKIEANWGTGSAVGFVGDREKG
ncbi:MAG: hypothetical protein PHC88_01990 [Terrimicrobiaceae bacterium]|nr:hypothetical protein [Terrimicrobiaceae bacterium]